MVEPSSPISSVFEAVFKVIEERLPFGRTLVTMTSALMIAVAMSFVSDTWRLSSARS